MSVLDPEVRPDDLASLEAGLDALDSEQGSEVSRWRRTWSATWPPVLTVALLIGVWQLFWLAKVKPDYALPSPGETFTTLKAEFSSGDLPTAIGNSLTHGAIGFVASVLVGTPLGLLIGRVRAVRRGIGPIVSGLQSLPSVAWVPAAIIFFGFSTSTYYAVMLLGAVPSIANGMVSGIDQVPPLYLRVGRVLGARGLTSARHVLIPAALPGYLAGLRQGWAFSWRSLMAAELIAVSPKLGLGLGQLLDQGREQSDMTLVFAGILAILVVGIAVELCVFAPVERVVLRRRGLVSRA